MKGYSELMQQLGVDPRAMLERHGLPLDLGENHDDMVPLEPIMALMEDSARLTRRADIGLQLAAFQDVQVLGPSSCRNCQLNVERSAKRLSMHTSNAQTS